MSLYVNILSFFLSFLGPDENKFSRQLREAAADPGSRPVGGRDAHVTFAKHRYTAAEEEDRN